MNTSYHLDLTAVINSILSVMVQTKDFLLNVTYEWNGHVWNAFDATISLLCIARVITILFGEFIGDFSTIDDDESDERYSDDPID